MTVKLTSSLPKSTHSNGLATIDETDLVEDTRALWVIAQLSPKKQTIDLSGNGDDTVELAVVAIEPLGGADAVVAAEMLHAARGRRTGHHPLPLAPDLEQIAEAAAAILGQAWPEEHRWKVGLQLGTLLSLRVLCAECDGESADPAITVDCDGCATGLHIWPATQAAAA